MRRESTDPLSKASSRWRAEIGERLGMACSTVSRILTWIGLGKLSQLDPPEVACSESPPPSRPLHLSARAKSPGASGGRNA